MRALAIVTVVMYHLWPSILPGGFLGVSLFFTLSGFVITSTLLNEEARHGNIDIRRFWIRRVRRLVPASVVVLTFVVAVWTATGWITRSITGDVISSAFYVENWRLIVSGHGYVDSSRSPVAHFWSLAIEMQFYLVAPLLFRVHRGRKGVLTALLLALISVSAVAIFVSSGDMNVTYFSTLTRMFEIIVGSLAAIIVTSHSWHTRTPNGKALATIGWASIACLIVFSRHFDFNTELISHGGLALFSLAWAAIVVSAPRVTSLNRVLSTGFAVWIGKISYSLYLIHWPVREVIAKSTLPHFARPWSTLAISLLLAVASQRWIEEPVRTRNVSPRTFRFAASTVVALLVAFCTVGLVTPRRDQDVDFEALRNQFAGDTSVLPTHEGATYVKFFGDSQALTIALGASHADPRIAIAGGYADLGCPVGRGGQRRGESTTWDDRTQPAITIGENCDWTTHWPDSIDSVGPTDVAVILAGAWDVVGRKIPALGDEWVSITDTRYRNWLQQEMAAAADSLHDAGATRVAWMTLPKRRGYENNNNVDIYNTLIRDVAAGRSWMSVVDVAGYLQRSGEDTRLRPDGIHFSKEGAARLMRDWLAAQLLTVHISH